MRVIIGMLVLLGSPNIGWSKVIDRIVAVVNDEVVTLSELQEGLRVPMAQLGSISDPIARNNKRKEILRVGLNRIVGRRLVLQEAARRNISVQSRDVDAHIKRVQSRQKWSDLQLQQYLTGQGLTMARFRKEIRTQMLEERVIGAVLGMRIRISESDLLNYYREQSTKSRQDYEVDAAHILKVVRAGATAAEEAAARQEIQEIINRVQAGEDFAALAKRYSQGPRASSGGSLGTIRRGTLNKALEDGIFALKAGEVDGPIRTPFGYHAIKSNGRRALPMPKFETVKGQLRQKLRREKLNTEMERWVAELKLKAFVDIRLAD